MNVFYKNYLRIYYAFNMFRISILLEQKRYSRATKIIENMQGRGFEKFWRFLAFSMCAHYQTNQNELSEKSFTKMIGIFIKKLQSGDISKQDLTWVVHVCKQEYNFYYEGIASYLDEEDIGNYDTVNPRIIRTFDIGISTD